MGHLSNSNFNPFVEPLILTDMLSNCRWLFKRSLTVGKYCALAIDRYRMVSNCVPMYVQILSLMSWTHRFKIEAGCQVSYFLADLKEISLWDWY